MALDVRADRAGQVVSAGLGRAPRARYLPIAEHGLIGDLHTVALVGTDGTIDWYCCPRFDSPSVFGAILDADRGGCFRIAPATRRLGTQAALLPGHERPDHALPHARTASARCRTSCRSRPAQRPPPPADPARARRARARCASASTSQPRFDYGARPRTRSIFARATASLFRSTRSCALTPLRRRCRSSSATAARAREFTLRAGRGGGVRARARARASVPRSVLRGRDARTRSSTPSTTGGAGSASRATTGAGARWCTARRSR